MLEEINEALDIPWTGNRFSSAGQCEQNYQNAINYPTPPGPRCTSVAPRRQRPSGHIAAAATADVSLAFDINCKFYMQMPIVLSWLSSKFRIGFLATRRDLPIV